MCEYIYIYRYNDILCVIFSYLYYVRNFLWHSSLLCRSGNVLKGTSNFLDHKKHQFLQGIAWLSCVELPKIARRWILVRFGLCQTSDCNSWRWTPTIGRPRKLIVNTPPLDSHKLYYLHITYNVHTFPVKKHVSLSFQKSKKTCVFWFNFFRVEVPPEEVWSSENAGRWEFPLRYPCSTRPRFRMGKKRSIVSPGITGITVAVEVEVFGIHLHHFHFLEILGGWIQKSLKHGWLSPNFSWKWKQRFKMFLPPQFIKKTGLDDFST